MNHEQVHSDSRCTDWSSNGINNRGVQRTGVKEKEKLGNRQSRKYPQRISVESVEGSRNGKQRAKCRQRIVGTARALQPKVPDPTTHGSAGKTHQHGDDSKVVISAIEWNSFFPLQEC